MQVQVKDMHQNEISDFCIEWDPQFEKFLCREIKKSKYQQYLLK